MTSRTVTTVNVNKDLLETAKKLYPRQLSNLFNEFLELKINAEPSNPLDYAQKVYDEITIKRLEIDRLGREIEETTIQAREFLGLKGDTTLDDYLEENVVRRGATNREKAINWIIERLEAPSKKLRGEEIPNPCLGYSVQKWIEGHGRRLKTDFGLSDERAAEAVRAAPDQWNGGAKDV